jgi:hypothetical protein
MCDNGICYINVFFTFKDTYGNIYSEITMSLIAFNIPWALLQRKEKGNKEESYMDNIVKSARWFWDQLHYGLWFVYTWKLPSSKN